MLSNKTPIRFLKLKGLGSEGRKSQSTIKTYRFMKKLLLPMLIAVALTACVNDTTEEIPIVKLKKFEIEASVEQTRTNLDVDNGALGILWAPNENIGVFGSTNQMFTSNNTMPAGKATFSGESDDPQFAYYPYCEEATDIHAVPFYLNGEQQMVDGEPVINEIDLKVGQIDAEGDGTFTCKFTQCLSLLKFVLDPSGSEVENLALDGIALTANDLNIDAEESLCGDFLVDITTGKLVPAVDGYVDTINLTFEDKPTMDSKVNGWMMVNPVFEAGESITITIFASGAGKSYVGYNSYTLKKTLNAGGAYSFPLKLSDFTFESLDAPQLLTFELYATDNVGKILSTQLYYDEDAPCYEKTGLNITPGALNSRYTGVTTTTTLEKYMFEVDQNNMIAGGCIPYLYDFVLTPRFTVSEGATVYVNDVEQTSGSSSVDFSSPVTYTVVSEDGVESNYTISITNSGLPIVVVDQSSSLSGGEWVTWEQANLSVRSKDSKWATDDVITIYNADGSKNVDAKVGGIRLRGNSTMKMPKKPFAIKFDKGQEVLGMPEHKRWVLLANWIDRTMIRNAVAFDLAHQTENAWRNQGLEQGMLWNPHGQNVELVIEGRHVGNYYLCEQIKIDGGRLAINDCYDDVEDDSGATTADDISNVGFLLEFDDAYDEDYKFKTTYRSLPCMFKDNPGTHYSAIQSKINTIDTNLSNGNYSAAYEQFDIYSIIDQWLVFETTMNNEWRYPKSVYMYVNGNGKLSAGPVWDFDYQTFPNFDGINTIYSYYKGKGESGVSAPAFTINTMMYSLYKSNSCKYMWYPLLFNDSTFKAAVKERWTKLKPYLLNTVSTIATLGAQNRVSAIYNDAMWPYEAGERQTYDTWFVDFSGDERMTYEESILNLQTVLQNRISAMDAQINAM